MKKKLMYLCMLVCTMGVFNSCSDDDESKDDLVGTWNLNPVAMDMTWESSEEISINGILMNTSAVATLAAQYGNTSLPEKLKSITFRDNNKLEATYLDGGTEKTDVYGTFRVVNGSKLNFTPDVDKLLEGVEGLNTEAIAAIKLLTAPGIPVYYTLAADGTSGRFYLDTKTIKEIKSLLPILGASLSGDDASTVMIKGILEQMPGILDKTDKIELGLNFNKATN